MHICQNYQDAIAKSWFVGYNVRSVLNKEGLDYDDTL